MLDFVMGGPLPPGAPARSGPSPARGNRWRKIGEEDLPDAQKKGGVVLVYDTSVSTVVQYSTVQYTYIPSNRTTSNGDVSNVGQTCCEYGQAPEGGRGHQSVRPCLFLAFCPTFCLVRSGFE